MIANRSPPIPFIIGSTNPITAFVAIAASTALPPCSRIRTPAWAANGDSAATIPPREITIERPCDRSCAKIPVAPIIVTASAAAQIPHRREFSPLTRFFAIISCRPVTPRALYRGASPSASGQEHGRTRLGINENSEPLNARRQDASAAKMSAAGADNQAASVGFAVEEGVGGQLLGQSPKKSAPPPLPPYFSELRILKDLGDRGSVSVHSEGLICTKIVQNLGGLGTAYSKGLSSQGEDCSEEGVIKLLILKEQSAQNKNASDGSEAWFCTEVSITCS